MVIRSERNKPEICKLKNIDIPETDFGHIKIDLILPPIYKYIDQKIFESKKIIKLQRL